MGEQLHPLHDQVADQREARKLPQPNRVYEHVKRGQTGGAVAARDGGTETSSPAGARKRCDLTAAIWTPTPRGRSFRLHPDPQPQSS